MFIYFPQSEQVVSMEPWPASSKKNRNYEVQVYCRRETRALLRKDCLAIIVTEEPSLKELRLSDGFILGKVIDGYLKSHKGDPFF